MPTTEPLELDGELGGQLEQIAAMHTAAPAATATAATRHAPVAAQPAAPRPAQAQAAPPKPTAKPAPSRIHGLRTSLDTPGVNLRHGIEKPQSAAAAASADTTQKRTQSFSDQDFAKVWKAYIDANPTQHIIVNTMRACPPVRDTAGGTHFTMSVENNIQVELMRSVLPELLRQLHDALSNDTIAIDFTVADASDSPMSWNQREVLAHIVQRHPGIQNLIDTLGLALD